MVRRQARKELQALSVLFAAQSRRSLQPGLCRGCVAHLGKADGLLEFVVGDGDDLVAMADYLKALLKGIMTPFDDRVRLMIAIDKDLALDFCRAQRIGLFFSEAVGNALKHAFPGLSGGSLEIFLRREGDALKLCVKDNGDGFYPSAEKEPDAGLGFMDTLAHSLGGEAQVKSGRGGTTVTLTCPA